MSLWDSPARVHKLAMCLWGSAILNPDLGLFRVPSASDCSCFCRSQGGTLLQEPTPPRQTDHSSVLETDGLSEVPGWGLFPTCFNQMPTICKAKGQRLEMAAVLSKVWKKNHWEKRQVWRSPRTHWGGGHTPDACTCAGFSAVI